MLVGKEGCDVIVKDSMVSRIHCVFVFDPEKRATYVIDASTNGTSRGLQMDDHRILVLSGSTSPPRLARLSQRYRSPGLEGYRVLSKILIFEEVC